MGPTNQQKRKKEQNNDDSSESDNDVNTNETSSSWPRFLVIEGINPEQPINKLSPFAIAKGIKGLAGEPKTLTKLRSGELLVEVVQRSHSTNLLRSTELANIPIKVSPHRSLNYRKGVIRCRDLKSCSDAEILEGLTSQHVGEVFHIKTTGTFILT